MSVEGWSRSAAGAAGAVVAFAAGAGAFAAVVDFVGVCARMALVNSKANRACFMVELIFYREWPALAKTSPAQNVYATSLAAAPTNEPTAAPMAAPARTSVRKCIPSKIREAATLAAQNNRPGSIAG